MRAQRSLAEANEELERQRRELSAGFAAQLAAAQADWRARADAAEAAAGLAHELAAARHADVVAAKARLDEQIEVAQVRRAQRLRGSERSSRMR